MLTAVSGYRHCAAARLLLFVTLLGSSLSLVLSNNNGAAVPRAAAAATRARDSVSSWSRTTAGHSPSTAAAATAAAAASNPQTAAAAAAAALSGSLAGAHDVSSLQDLAWPTTSSHVSTRQLLQSSTVETACSSSGASSSGFNEQTDPTYVLQIAEGLLGDSRLRITDARLRGSCSALGSASFSAPHAFAAFFPAAVVLSTGDAMQAAGDMQEGGKPLSTDLYQPGDPRIGAYTHDAAVLEIDISTSPAVGGNEQLVLSYMFGSEEYGTKNPNPDMLSITISSSSSSGTGGSSSSSGWGAPMTDLAVLPGGGRVPVPSTAAGGKPAVQVFSNSGGKYRTALNGFTQVVPSQGYAVQPGSTYTLRIAVADANHGLVDSVLMLPAGAIRLAAGPTSVTGGPYAVAPNSKLTMHGAKSHSPNGAILSYRWTITPYPALSSSSSSSSSGSEALVTATGAAVTVAAPPPGDYNVTLEVSDTLGAYSCAVTALSVDPANVLNWWSSTGFATPAPMVAPRPTAVLAVNGSKAEALFAKARSDGPAVVDLDGSGSHDGRGSALVYKWTVTQTEPLVKEVEVMTPFVQPPRLVQSLDPGVYLVALDVSGPGGSNSKQVLITVAANSAPVAMPGGPYTATVGKPVMVDAGGSTDPDGDPLTYSWTLSRSDSVIGRYNGSTLSMTLNKPGSYGLLLTVRDDRGGVSSASTEINSYITPPPPPAPVLTPQRTAAAVGPAAAAAVPAPANARVSAASLPQSATAAAVPQLWGSAGTSGGYESAGNQPQAYGQLLPQQQQQQQQLLQAYQQQPVQQQQLLPAAYQQLPYQQLQQQQTLAVQQPQQQQQYLQTLPAPATQLYTQQPYALPQQQQQQQAIPTASATPGMPSATSGVGMCLFKDGKPDYNPWNAAAAIQGRLAGAYWGPCPMTTTSGSPAAPARVPLGPVLPSTPPPAAPAPAASAADGAAVSGSSSVSVAGADKAEPVQSIASIRSPEAFVKAEGAATQVFLDAGSSTAAPGRSIVAYHWTVHSKADNSVITSVDGQRTPVWLGPGEYSLDLQVTDTSGQTATAKREFAVGDVAATLAHISSPLGFVELSDGGSIQVQLSAAGSKAGPGRSITSYSWSVTRLPDNIEVASGDGPSATASLPGGTYKVQLTVGDSGGGHAIASTDLSIGGKGSTGATAVISWPPSVVQSTAAAAAAAAEGTTSNGSSNTDGTVLVRLDASGSEPARSGSNIRQYVWAVLSLPDRQPVGNATGCSSAIRLLSGSYQAGLLVLDADGGTATARKNFVVQQGPASNRAPIIPQDMEMSGASEDKISIPDVTDPDGDTVTVSWSLMNQISGLTVSGKGLELSLEGLNPGSYLLLITAADGRGGESSGTAHVTVTPAKYSTTLHGASGEVSVAAAGHADVKQQQQHQQQLGDAKDGYHSLTRSPSSSSSSSSSYKPPGEVASIFSGPSGQKKLPVLSMPQGSVLSLDAAAFHLLPLGAKAKSFAWELQQRGTGQQVATVYGRIGRFELPSLASYNVRLLATDTEGDDYSSTGSVRVLDASEVGGLAAVLNLRGLSPVVSVRGQCGPFKAAQYAAATLSCPELELGDNSSASLQWAWKVTPIATQSSSSSSSSNRDDEPQAQAKLGKDALFLGLEPGLYRVELAVGVGQQAPSSKNTAYYLATFLQVSPTKSLTLTLPPSAVCSGQPVSLEAPPLELPTDGPQPEFAWRVTQTAAPAQVGALVTAAATADSAAGMQGTGKTFGFTAVQPGRYEVSLVAKLPDGTSVTGEGVIKVKACVGCKQGTVDVVIPRGTCAASDKQAAAVLIGILPAGLEVSWADGTDVSPGLRNVTVTAQLPGTRARDPSGRAFLAPSCRALISFQDKEAPKMTLLYEEGLCLSPPNNKWNCWHAHQLVSITDNCQSGQDLSFRVNCGRHSSQPAGAGSSSSSSTCQVLPDGRVCVKAADVGQVTWVSVAAKDSHGNVADPIDVSVKVRTLLEEQKQCSRPDMVEPGVAPEPVAAPAPAAEVAPAVQVVSAAPAGAAVMPKAEDAPRPFTAPHAARTHRAASETQAEANTEPAGEAAAVSGKVAKTHNLKFAVKQAVLTAKPAAEVVEPAAAERVPATLASTSSAGPRARKVHRVAAVTTAQPADMQIVADETSDAMDRVPAGPAAQAAATAAAISNRMRKVRTSVSTTTATAASNVSDVAQLSPGDTTKLSTHPTAEISSSAIKAKAQRLSAKAAVPPAAAAAAAAPVAAAEGSGDADRTHRAVNKATRRAGKRASSHNAEAASSRAPAAAALTGEDSDELASVVHAAAANPARHAGKHSTSQQDVTAPAAEAEDSDELDSVRRAAAAKPARHASKSASSQHKTTPAAEAPAEAEDSDDSGSVIRAAAVKPARRTGKRAAGHLSQHTAAGHLSQHTASAAAGEAEAAKAKAEDSAEINRAHHATATARTRPAAKRTRAALVPATTAAAGVQAEAEADDSAEPHSTRPAKKRAHAVHAAPAPAEAEAALPEAEAVGAADPDSAHHATAAKTVRHAGKRTTNRHAAAVSAAAAPADPAADPDDTQHDLAATTTRHAGKHVQLAHVATVAPGPRLQPQMAADTGSQQPAVAVRPSSSPADKEFSRKPAVSRKAADTAAPKLQPQMAWVQRRRHDPFAAAAAATAAAA